MWSTSDVSEYDTVPTFRGGNDAGVLADSRLLFWPFEPPSKRDGTKALCVC